MREIKFRAWTGFMMEYDIIVGKLGAFYAKELDEEDKACISRFNTIYTKETPIMQFTGLKDKNGVEIYESDIIINPQGKKFYIGECCGGLSLISVFHYGENYNDLIADPINDLQNASYIQESGEIIGNIYQNPELLTKGD